MRLFLKMLSSLFAAYLSLTKAFRRKNPEKDAYFNPYILNFNSRICKALRPVYWKFLGVRAEEHFYISNDVKIIAPAKLVLGKNVKILNNCIVDARGGIAIGDFSQIGFESIILSSSHRFSDLTIPIAKQGMEFKKVVIGHNVWIGTRVVVLFGVTIANDVIIGAMSLVNKNCSSAGIYGGVPCKYLSNIG